MESNCGFIETHFTDYGCTFQDCHTLKFIAALTDVSVASKCLASDWVLGVSTMTGTHHMRLVTGLDA